MTAQDHIGITDFNTREIIATKEYVNYVSRTLQIDDLDFAARIADFTVREIEHYGAKSAALYFDDEGSGPWCSWCGSLAGLCKHIMRNGEDEKVKSQ